jgi:pimeloyl-ACP methyl ester carboxylesterase
MSQREFSRRDSLAAIYVGIRSVGFHLLVLLPVLAAGPGCGRERIDFPLPRAGAAAESVARETRTFEIGTERFTAEYGTIIVAETRGNPSSRLISIPFLRIHSSAGAPAEPIFGFAGGPGMSNITWDWQKALPFLPEHDFVVVGYRGVDGSTVLDCPEVAEAMSAGGDPLGEESLMRIGQAWNASAQRLTAQGVDLRGYTMIETIDDNESVRKAIGYDRINLLSESYGTRIAYLYGLRYPEKIHRSAMLAVNPPGHFTWDRRVIDAQLRQYAALWARDSSMSLRSSDLYASLRTVLNNMPRRWLLFPIDPGRVRVSTFGLLSHRGTAAMVFDAFVAAEHGDPSGLALMSVAYNYVLPTMGMWGDLASKAVSADFDTARDYRGDRGSSDFPLGSPMNVLSWGPLAYCRWPTGRLDEEWRQLRRSDVETLLLSGNLDFSTPAEFATRELLPCLTRGRQIILSDCGHVNDLWHVRPANTRLMLTTFYRTGIPDLSLNAYTPMDFRVSWGFTRIAAIAVSAATLLILALAALTLRIVQRHRQRGPVSATGTPHR